MQISQSGLQQIIQREGVILHAYTDSVGVWTIGTGHTTAAGPPTVSPGMTITKAQNDQILLQDLKPIQKQFTQYVKVPVTQNQYDAIISIVFNVGPKFWHSTAIQRLNAGDINGAAKAILLWNIPREIIGRRKTEQKQFLTPDSQNASSFGPISDSTSLSDIDSNVSSASNIFGSIKNFFKDNFKTNIIPIGAGGAAAMYTHYWPYILVGAVALAGLGWYGFYLYERKSNVSTSS